MFNRIDQKTKWSVVGNIPYDASEEQLKEIFAEVGPVAKFRFVNTDYFMDKC